MQLMVITGVGPAPGAGCRNRFSIEASRLLENARRNLTVERDSASSPLFESSFVQKCVGICINQLVRKLRGDRRVNSKALDASILNSAQHTQQSIEIHPLLKE